MWLRDVLGSRGEDCHRPDSELEGVGFRSLELNCRRQPHVVCGDGRHLCATSSRDLGGICVTASTPETQQRTEERAERPDFGFALSAGVLLAFNAGFINAIGLLSRFTLAVSHVTGSASIQQKEG